MSGNNGGTGEGSRTRSFSESDIDKINEPDKVNEANLDSESQIDQNPGLISSIDTNVYQSNPNLTSRGELLETPVGRGVGTRFQFRREEGANVKQDKALKESEALIKEIEKWLDKFKHIKPPDLDKISEGAERFKRRIARISQEALIRMIDRSVIDRLADSQIRVEKLRKRAEREDRKIRNLNPPRLSSTTESESEDVFRPNIQSTSIDQGHEIITEEVVHTVIGDLNEGLEIESERPEFIPQISPDFDINMENFEDSSSPPSHPPHPPSSGKSNLLYLLIGKHSLRERKD